MPIEMTNIDAAKFYASKFFTLTLRKWGNAAKVKNPSSYLEYIKQAVSEAKDRAQTMGVAAKEILADAKVTVEIDS